MDLASLITWELGIVSTILAGVLGRLAQLTGRNGREVAELRGRVDVLSHTLDQLRGQMVELRARMDTVGTATHQVAGQIAEMSRLLQVQQEHLLARPRGGG